MLNSLNKIDNTVLSSVKRLSPLNMKRSNNNHLFAFVANHLIYYPTPISLTYTWSFGFLAGMCLLTQMISGIFLAMYYAPHVDLAFSSVEYIMCDVPNGWFLRYVHANGASMFFIVVYSHIFRGLYYGSYMKPREILWCSGLIVAGGFVFCCNQSITSIFLIFWTIFQFSLLFFYGLRFSSLARQVVNLYSMMYPTTWIASKHRFRIILLFVVILFIGIFQKDSLTCCGWEQWKPCEAGYDNIELLHLLGLKNEFSRKLLIGDTDLALKELDEIDRFLNQSNDNNKIKVLEAFYLRKDFNEMKLDSNLYNYYQVIKTTLIRAQDGNLASLRHTLIDQTCHALPAVSEKLMPHGCVVGRAPNQAINIIHKPEYSYLNVPILNDTNSFEQLFREYLNYLLTCRNSDVLENDNLLPKADGGEKGSTLEYSLVFLDLTNEDIPYRLTCWLSPSDSNWNTVIVPETAHLGAPLITCTGKQPSIDPVLSKFGIGMLPSSPPTWESLEGKSFASLLVRYKQEVPIPAFTIF